MVSMADECSADFPDLSERELGALETTARSCSFASFGDDEEEGRRAKRNGMMLYDRGGARQSLATSGG